MTFTLAASLCALATALAPAAPLLDDVSQASPGASSAAPAPPMAEGQVTKVDAAAGTVTLRHGEIANLDMPPMTMVFQVRDASLLGKVKAGDRVRFAAARLEGVITVTAIEVAN